MPISTVNRVKTIAVNLSESDLRNVVTLYQNTNLAIGTELIPGYTIISFNAFIKNLKAFAQIGSLPEIAMPNFDLGDSDTTRRYKTLEVEWKSPRKQLSLYIANKDSDWSKVGSISLLNPSGYPYRVYNIMDLYTANLAIELGEDGRLGIGVDNVGQGLLASNDTVTIHGSYLEEIFVQSIDIPLQTYVYLSGQVSVPAGENLLNNDRLIDNEFLLNN